MQNKLKKELYDYFKAKKRLNKEEKKLLSSLESEMNYADIESMAVCYDDVFVYADKAKLNEESWERLCEIAERMDDYLADDFGNALNDVLEGDYDEDEDEEDDDD